MNAYRNDFDAVLARNSELEKRVRDLERQLTPTRATKPAAPAAAPLPSPMAAGASAAAEIAAMVNAKEDVRYRKRVAGELATTNARDRRIVKHSLRPLRIAAERRVDLMRVSIARTRVRDAMKDQWFWGIVFLAINPGFAVLPFLGIGLYMLGLSPGASGIAALPLWLTLLVIGNVLYARWKHPTWHIDLTHDGNFAVHRGTPRRAKLVGRASELKVPIAEADPSELHEITLRHETGDLTIGYLTARDLAALRATLAGHCQV